MILFIQIFVSIILLLFAYKWYEYYKLKTKLSWLAKVPGWPILGNVLEFGNTSETLYKLERLVKKYGKLIDLDCMMEPSILTADYDFVEFLLGTNTILNKSDDYRLMRGWLGTGLLTSDGPKWRQRRKMITPAFHFSILEQFITYFDSNGKILIEQLEKELDKEIDIYPFISLYTLDIICETAMGVSVNAQKSRNSKYVANVKEMCRIIIDRTFSLFKGHEFSYKLSRDYYKELRIVKELHSVTYSVIERRRRELENKLKSDTVEEKDDVGIKKKMAFLDILLQSTVDGKPLSKDDIREEVDTFMFAGHDTTTSAISFTMYLLAKYPEVQDRALEEQRMIFNDDITRSATYNDLQEMKYLELVIKESLRVYPPVPLFGRQANEDTEYKGHIIPKGINITVFSYAMLRDPEYFDDPEKFNPDRFRYNREIKPYSFIPFSAGARNCLGQKFAMLELKSTLSKILRNFEVLMTTPEHVPILVAEAVVKSSNGIRIKLARRKW